jgi:hypothetical protein
VLREPVCVILESTAARSTDRMADPLGCRRSKPCRDAIAEFAPMDVLLLPPPRGWRAQQERLARRRLRRRIDGYRRRSEADPREFLRYIVFCKDSDIRIESWARDKLAAAFGAWLLKTHVPLEHFVLGERWEQHARTVLHMKIIREAVKVIAIAGIKGDRKFGLASKLVDLYNQNYSTTASFALESMHTYYYTKKAGQRWI